jgi:hypothetical protein
LKQLQQRAKKGEIGLYYIDECGFSSMPEVQRAWSKVGVPHLADASIAKTRLNVLGALDFAGRRLIYTSHQGSVCETHVIAFMDDLIAKCPSGRLNFAVMDNASIHRYIDQETRDRWLAAGLVLCFIPPYSPELNLIEIVWKQAKYHWREFVAWLPATLRTSVHQLLDGFGSQFNINFG